MNSVPSFNFIRYSKLTIAISAVLLVLSILSMVVRGFNLGIDFTGGVLLERNVGREVTAAEVREVLQSPELEDLNLSGAIVQPLSEQGGVLIRFASETTADVARIDEALAAAFGSVEDRRTEFVGPVIGAELVRNALFALTLAAVGMLIYLWFRFEVKFSVVAIATVLHNVIVVLGVVSFFQLEVNSPFIAAILTVLGYSINDTIVIFDRIREHLQLRNEKPSADMVNRSLNETLTRTINTGLTTLLVVVSLLLFGGETIRDFMIVLLVGIVVGAYASVFLASPIWLWWRLKGERKPHAMAQ